MCGPIVLYVVVIMLSYMHMFATRFIISSSFQQSAVCVNMGALMACVISSLHSVSVHRYPPT